MHWQLKVTDNVDVEWLFGKTILYIIYLHQTILPPPLNLTPTVKGIANGLEWLQALTKNTPEKMTKFSISNCCYIERQPDEKLTRDFPVLMTQLVRRYFREKNGANEGNQLTEIEGIRAEIDDVKQLLKEALAPIAVEKQTDVNRETPQQLPPQ